MNDSAAYILSEISRKLLLVSTAGLSVQDRQTVEDILDVDIPELDALLQDKETAG